MNDYEIHGGVHTFKGDVNHVEAHGGVYYFNGSVEHFVNHGGVVYDQRPSNRVEYIFDGVKESELNALRMQVSQLQDKYRWAEDQRLRLRAKLDERSEQSEHIPDDDVLIRKIRSLEHELHEEREARKREVAELKERIDVAMEINAKLRRHDDDHNKRDQLIADEHIDILATILAAYPFTPSGDLEFEFGLPEQKIRFVAQTFQSMKSKDARDAAREYLRKQGIELVDRRGGDKGKHPNKRKVEQVARNGRVLATFDSIVEAAEATGYDQKKVGNMCRQKRKTYTKEGYTFRFKENENQNSK